MNMYKCDGCGAGPQGGSIEPMPPGHHYDYLCYACRRSCGEDQECKDCAHYEEYIKQCDFFGLEEDPETNKCPEFIGKAES